MEIFDIVDENGIPTGETVERTVAHGEGYRHRTAHVWIVRKQDGKWQILLQKRAPGKDSFPGCYDTSSAGHITAGCEPMESALRELSEELGIYAAAEDLEFIGTFGIDYEKEFYGKMFRDKEVAFVHVLKKQVDIDQITVQEEEVEAVKWFDLDFLDKALNPRDKNFCVPMGSFLILQDWCSKH